MLSSGRYPSGDVVDFDGAIIFLATRDQSRGAYGLLRRNYTFRIEDQDNLEMIATSSD